MPKLYPLLQLLTTSPVNSLSKWAQTHVESEVHGKLQLSEYDDDVKIRCSFQINSMPGKYTFLVWKDTSDEVVLNVTGYIADYVLPPVTKNTNNNWSILYKLSVLGPDDHLFKKALSALHLIYAFFEESFPEGVM
ncbi:hypothetical protein L208DRAFT_1339472 [Tricholoma matsutake]|nr:hypothetical protein L208DRAFT_1339472 [Tricholoma matsutake 945]